MRNNEEFLKAEEQLYKELEKMDGPPIFDETQYDRQRTVLRALLWDAEIPPTLAAEYGISKRRPSPRGLAEADRQMFRAYLAEQELEMDKAYTRTSLEGDNRSAETRIKIHDRLAKLLGLDDKSSEVTVHQGTPYDRVMEGIIVEVSEDVPAGQYLDLPIIEDDNGTEQ